MNTTMSSSPQPILVAYTKLINIEVTISLTLYVGAFD
jgi:hypothetical protein